ncbi:MAG: integrase [Sphingomonadales bacterium 28-55-16]|nr:MAG: integrase [Sphingomonadales bacterium 28-55-16]
MVSKKKRFGDDEIAIFDDGCIYKRGDYWHFRLWLKAENKYARKSLGTTNRATALERGKVIYLELLANQQSGKKYFSLNAKEGVRLFLERRTRDIGFGIRKGRHGTITTHLNHWLDFIGRDAKLKDLGRTACEDYFNKRMASAKRPLAHTTLLNEQGTINSMMKYLFRHNEVLIDSFDFPKLDPYHVDTNLIKRQTFTPSEYQQVIKAMRAYGSKVKNKLDDDEWRMRQLMRHYFIIAANSGLRSGEQQQLRWSDVEIVRNEKGQSFQHKILARISVRKETSKVKKPREFLCRGGFYFERLRELFPPKNLNDLIFSLDGETRLTNRAVGYHFDKITEQAGIADRKIRKIVPYSLRHFMVTHRVLSGLSFQQVAEMIGSSAFQIGKVYYHLNEERRFTNATADYVRDESGRYIPI